MIRVTVELVPLGIESEARTIATARIWNDATGTPAVGNYGYRLDETGAGGALAADGRVTGFDRRLSVWRLISLVLADIHHRLVETHGGVGR